jgi:mono/diheme cytochrome c family protein
MVSPFGTIRSSNITPDPQHGIGRYTYQDFARALREGVARGGKRLYPAMPYASFARIEDHDMRALYAYMMQGVPPVAKATLPSDVAFPFNQRWALRFWQMAFVPRDVYRPRADRDAQWNRGAYLVQSVGHCGACHTPRGIAYQERGGDESSSKYLTGGITDNWFAPNLTGDAGSGLGRMLAGDVASFLKTGHGAGVIAYGSMVEQIEDSSQYLTDDDLNAVAHYLKSLPAQQPSGTYTPRGDAARSSANGNRLPDRLSLGLNVYQSFCARCRRGDGTGVPHVYPSLAGNPSVLTEDTSSLIRLLVEGGNSPSTLTGPPRTAMPGFANTLADVQIAQVLTYVRSAWGNNAQPITANDVSALRQRLHK